MHDFNFMFSPFATFSIGNVHDYTENWFETFANGKSLRSDNKSA